MVIAAPATLRPDATLAVTFALGKSCSLSLIGKVTSCLPENGTEPPSFVTGITFRTIEENEQFVLLSLLKELREPSHTLPKLTISLVTLDEELSADSQATPLLSPVAPALHRRVRTVTTRRVVITGIGAVSPNGIGRKAFWQGLAGGENCISRIRSFDPAGHPSQIAAEIHAFDAQAFIQTKEVKRMGRSAHLAIAAARQAIEDAQLELTSELKAGIGTIIGTGTSGLEYAEHDFYAMRDGGVKRMRPYAAIAGFGGALSSEVSRALGLTGRSITISTGCTGSTDAIGEALQLIRYGATEILLAGGADAPITPAILGAFCQIGAVSMNFNDTPQKASRPFNKDRDGFVLGEGSWMFVLEELNHALRRDATIYGELIGYAAKCDAFHMSRPLPSGEYTAQAMKLALNDAMVEPHDIDYIAAYGNATPVNDSYETMVIKNVFGSSAPRLLVSSIKSMIGHPIGSCGAGQLAASLMAISTGIVPPTINYEVPDPECDLDYVPNSARVAEVRTALCNTLAFGSKNAALVVRRFDPQDDI
jgi:3-oxoacyl-[acyl-carrier-protein] synthase II